MLYSIVLEIPKSFPKQFVFLLRVLRAFSVSLWLFFCRLTPVKNNFYF